MSIDQHCDRLRERSRCRFVLALVVGVAGCGYQLGARAIETPNHEELGIAARRLRSIAVPVFANLTLRRGFERDLTRAVQREIKETLPYVLASSEDADATLKGEILGISETVLVEGSQDQVLENNIEILVAIELIDRSGQALALGRQTGLGGSNTRMIVSDRAEYVVARGETRDTATREAIKEISERIVQVLAGPP